MKNGARYLVRFDDICPTMNWQVWEKIQQVLRQHKIKPILAVVPDNQDSNLVVAAACADFWKRVRQWQDWGWTIALHGFQHVYVNRNPGVMGVTPASEFSGLCRLDQEAKLRAGLAIFHSHGITTETWIAPSHSFDSTTLDILQSIGIRVISDGFTTRAFADRLGLIWVPCQQWDRFRPKADGLYTVCFHHNRWSSDCVEAFRQDIEGYHSRIIGLAQLMTSAAPAPLRPDERLLAWARGSLLFRFKRGVKRLFL